MTYWTFLFASLAIIGAPPFAGFFSKDEILWRAFSRPTGGGVLLWLVGFITAGMTALYIWRLVFLTFFGESRVDHEVEHHIHESPPTMTVPLMVSAVLRSLPAAGSAGPKSWEEAIVWNTGWSRSLPGPPRRLESEAAHSGGQEFLFMALSVAMAACGVLLAYYLF